MSTDGDETVDWSMLWYISWKRTDWNEHICYKIPILYLKWDLIWLCMNGYHHRFTWEVMLCLLWLTRKQVHVMYCTGYMQNRTVVLRIVLKYVLLSLQHFPGKWRTRHTTCTLLRVSFTPYAIVCRNCHLAKKKKNFNKRRTEKSCVHRETLALGTYATLYWCILCSLLCSVISVPEGRSRVSEERGTLPKKGDKQGVKYHPLCAPFALCPWICQCCWLFIYCR